MARASPYPRQAQEVSDELLLLATLRGTQERLPGLAHTRRLPTCPQNRGSSYLNLDTRGQTLYLNTEMIMEWHDHYLEWEPDLYNGTSVIRVPYHEIWYPDVILYNTADPNYQRSIISTNAIVKSTGQVKLLSHAMFLSSCDIDTTWYPFDQQDCTLYLSSWTYDSSKVGVSAMFCGIPLSGLRGFDEDL
ncbi:neuronal acetylcholine receptor subunit beta-4-like [Penaeus monodon]|uniref:neuronal acetylcholine receptor subunit beta-4-like n=1 Tax=Penaeus monodon TaxID=6687 RepID=UPI0018A7A33F|nr:neuronal acetylcholine receptor subunit beta-4-like [Penaeus monodon]